MLFTFFFVILLSANAQIATSVVVTGSNSTLNATFNAAIVVDPFVSINSNGTINGFKAQITRSYTSGDLLTSTASLPSGVTASYDANKAILTFVGTLSAAQWETVLRGVEFTSTSSVCYPTLREISFIAGQVFYNTLTDHFYEFVTQSGNWPQAKTSAEQRSYFGKVGYLATMQSAAENNFIWKIMSSDAWFGASDNFTFVNAAKGFTAFASQSAVEGKWHWISGPEAGTQFSGSGSLSGQYSNWNPGEPNNSRGEHSGQFYSGQQGRWNDLGQTGVLPGYLVEYGGMPNDILSNTPIKSRDLAVSGSSSGSISGGNINICSGSNSTVLSLSGLTGNVVRWEYSFDNFFTNGVPISNTSSSYTAVNITQSTYYRAIVNATSPNNCNGLTTSSTELSVNPTLPGNVTAVNSTICSGGSVDLILSGNQGNIIKWQRSSNNTTWIDIANTSSNLVEAVNTTGTIYYRAVVQTPGCGAAINSASKSIVVISGTPPSGGVVSSLLLCFPSNSGTITLSGYSGTIQKWQSSVDNGIIWSDISNTSTTYSITNATGSRLYRAVLVNGTCGLAYSSPSTVSVSAGLAVTVASSSNVSCNGLNDGNINLSVTAGIAPYSYLWSNSATTPTVTGLSAGTYTVTVTDANVCSSAVSNTITEPTSSGSSSNITTCDNHRWTQNNVTYTASGVFTDTVSNSVGCDSVITLNLTINNATASSFNVTACDGYTWTQKNATYTASGVFTDTVSNSAGCDSVITLNLTINNATASSFNVTACDGYTWAQKNATYTASGTHTDTVSNSAGCDSVITLNLTINNATASSFNVTACDGYTWTQKNATYTASGTYTDTVSNSVGCDSVITLNLTINNATASSFNVTACDGYTWTQKNATYTASGTYTDTVSNSAGCDSVITLNLTINNSDSTVITNVACGSYTWSQTNLTYTASGQYIDTTQTVLGCDSLVKLNLTIVALDLTISTLTGSLVSNDTNATAHQWINCDSSGSTISGANSAVYNPTVGGNYAVIVTNGACIDTSACQNVIITSVRESASNATFVMYPNPTEGKLYIEMEGPLSTLDQVQVYSMTGQLVQEELILANRTELDLSNLERGVYLIKYGQKMKKVILINKR